jgi:hypothetical protein
MGPGDHVELAHVVVQVGVHQRLDVAHFHQLLLHAVRVVHQAQ